jgi:hypothetical protein
VITYSQPTFPNYAFTTTQGTWTNAPTSFSYKWCLGPSDAVNQNCSTPRSTGPTMTLQWPSGDGTVWVGVTATNAAGSTTAETYVSFHASEFTVVDLPTIVIQGGGPPRVGSSLYVRSGGYTGLATGAPSMQSQIFQATWLRCDTKGLSCQTVGGTPQGGYGTLPYVVKAADSGSTIRVLDRSNQVPGTNRPIVVASAPTAVITP